SCGVPLSQVSNSSSLLSRTGIRSWLIVATSEFGCVVRMLNTSNTTDGPPGFNGPTHWRQTPAKANGGRGSSPHSANQCHVAGRDPFGSQKDDAGTRQRRWRNDSRQNGLVSTLSSRTFVTRFAARLGWGSTKPQDSNATSRSPSAALRTTGASCPGKTAARGSNAAHRL